MYSTVVFCLAVFVSVQGYKRPAPKDPAPAPAPYVAPKSPTYGPQQPSYGSHQPSYGSHQPSYGPSPYGGYAPPPPPPPPKQGLNDLDLVLRRINDVNTAIKTLQGVVTSLQARAAAQADFIQQITLYFAKEEQVEINQDGKLVFLQQHADLADGLLDELEGLIGQVTQVNEDNAADLVTLQISIANVPDNTALVYNTVTQINNFTPLVLQTIVNKLTSPVNFDTAALTGNLNTDETIALSRYCEVNRVTLRQDVQQIEVKFQHTFDRPPQLLWGIAGFKADLDVLPDPIPHGYGYGYKPPRQPESLGFQTQAWATSTGFTITGVDQAFGDSMSLTADLEVLACSIGPVAEPVLEQPRGLTSC